MDSSEKPCIIDPADVAICLGHDEPIFDNHGTMMPPVVQTSLFAKEKFADLLAGFTAEHSNYVYTRGQNPTVEALEKKLTALEQGEACKCLASGMAAVSAVMYGLLKSGDHILFVNNIYGPTLQLANHLQRFGISHSISLSHNPDEIERDIRPETRLIYFESPGTMTFHMLDIPKLAALARKHGILTAFDNTWATPLFLKPIPLGVDIVVHSLTKYVGGHSDVVAGAIITSEAIMKQIFYNAYLLNGGALAPWNAWLLIRGLRTLPARMAQHHSDTLAIARYLQNHPAVKTVFHPALHPEDRELAAQQLGGYAGLFSIELQSDKFDDLNRFIDALRLFRIGVSWGGAESLVISPANGKNDAALRKKGIPLRLVRFSTGLEGVAALTADLGQALATIT